MQSHRLLLTASAVICSFGLAMNSAEASISHVGIHSSPHVGIHSSSHVGIHSSPHVRRSMTHSRPARSVTKSKKTSLLTAMSQSKQLRLAQSAKRFTRKQTSRVFAANRIAPAYQTAYHRQSIICNPWFWLFMINHHRINQQTRADAQYLKGYRYGMQQGQSDLKAYSRQHQNLTADQKRMHNSR